MKDQMIRRELEKKGFEVVEAGGMKMIRPGKEKSA